MTKIEELEQKLNECQKELAELKESKKEKWLPKLGEYYWYRDSWGDFKTCKFANKENLQWRYNNVPMFPNVEKCKRYWRFMDTVKEKSYEFNREEWEDVGVKKYLINYDFYDKEFNIDSYCSLKKIGATYFKTEESAQYIIDNFKEELMTYWL